MWSELEVFSLIVNENKALRVNAEKKANNSFLRKTEKAVPFKLIIKKVSSSRYHNMRV